MTTLPNGQQVRISVEYLDEPVSNPTPPHPPLIGQTSATLPISAPIALSNVEPLKTVTADSCLLDHPNIGGRLTLFVLLYGDYYDMHRKCLKSILETTTRDRVELRVGSNQLGEASLRMVNELVESRDIRLHYRHEGNDKKYPVMREMFWDPSNPIETKWLIWFDDDTMCNKNPAWLDSLATLLARFGAEYAMFGPQYHYSLAKSQMDKIKASSWYRNRPFRNKHGRACPNGNKAHFCSGSLWCLRTDAMQKCNIPDPDLGHNGGDVWIGEQLYQGGFLMKDWSSGKSVVEWSSVKRRGLSERHIGT